MVTCTFGSGVDLTAAGCVVVDSEVAMELTDDGSVVVDSEVAMELTDDGSVFVEVKWQWN